MTQLSSSKVVAPFGEINTFEEPDGSLRVKATVLMTPAVEGAQTGLAIDGSLSMKNLFGVSLSPLFASTNVVEPVARTFASYLSNFDGDGNTTVIYWACGVGGSAIEEIGDLNTSTASTTAFRAPKQFGTGTKLLPAVKYFTEAKFPNVRWSLFVFVTDGVIEDLEEVKQYSIDLAKQIAAKDAFVKLVLIGIGPDVDEKQMLELDDLNYGGIRDSKGHEIDLWDHKLAAEMTKLEEIFAEVVDEDTILAPSADITDGAGNPVSPIGRSSYKDGFPALLNFAVPKGTTEFILNVNGNKIVQTLA